MASDSPADALGSVAIAGAGLIGASIAWRLAQCGMRVTLIDAGTLGGETSSAGAGMLSPGGEFDQPSVWLDLGIESMRMYPAFVDELRAETGMPIDFGIRGCHQFTDQLDQALKRREFQSAAGISVEQTPDGLFYPEDGYVDPTHLLRALREACLARGVAIVEQHPLATVDSTQYAAVVIAAGAWSSQLQVTHGGRPVPLPPVKPIKGHLIGFDLEPGTLGPMLRHGHTYVLQRASGFTIAGSTELDAGFDRTVDPSICEELHQRAAKLWPALAKVAPVKRWVGFRPFSTVPRIGRVEGTNVWLAYGHYRNGILLAPVTARRIAHEIAL
jgi:glycine oxidase